MDYNMLRKYIQKRLLEVTLAWNQAEAVYPVRPADLTEAQGKMWDMFQNSEKLGTLSAAQTAIFKAGIEDMMGHKFPDTSSRTLRDIPPYVVLTVATKERRGLTEGRPIMKKLSGPWVTEGGEKVELYDAQSGWFRLPTKEDVEAIISNVPDAQLAVPFCGLLPLEATEDSAKAILAKAKKVTKELFKAQPARPDVSDKELKMYTYSNANVGSDTTKLIFMAVDLEWVDDKNRQVYEYQNSTPTLQALTCVEYKGTPAVFISPMAIYQGGKLLSVTTSTWNDLKELSAEAVKTVLEGVPIGMYLHHLEEDERAKILEEVKLE